MWFNSTTKHIAFTVGTPTEAAAAFNEAPLTARFERCPEETRAGMYAREADLLSRCLRPTPE
jgi:hypothetical protein